MPVKNGQGYSKYTPDKEFGLAAVLQQHMSICNCIFGRHYVLPTYYYIDCNCGYGRNENIEGSPIIFYHNRHVLNHRISSVFLDINNDNITALKTACPWNPIRKNGESTITDKFQIFCCDNRIIVPKIAKQIKSIELRTKKLAYGLYYIDPNGIPDLTIIKAIGHYCKHIDILIRINGTALKRIAKACNKNVRLEDVIRHCNKSTIILRAPLDKDPNQWTFILASNYINYKAWTSKRFYDIESKQGIEIFNKVNYTIDELSDEDNQPIIDLKTFNLFEEDL